MPCPTFPNVFPLDFDLNAKVNCKIVKYLQKDENSHPLYLSKILNITFINIRDDLAQHVAADITS